jgi:hypothetical protein
VLPAHAAAADDAVAQMRCRHVSMRTPVV